MLLPFWVLFPKILKHDVNKHFQGKYVEIDDHLAHQYQYSVYCMKHVKIKSLSPVLFCVTSIVTYLLPLGDAPLLCQNCSELTTITILPFINLNHLAASEMTYIVSSGALNSTPASQP